ncbi:MAG: IS1634 family transposase, partial [Myxococcota bacterium]|nr:IS1634 family transposase [Myxococcota bacterium]
MYVTDIPNRGSRPATLLRESYREDGQIKSRTLANLSKWPRAKVEALRALLRDKQPVVGGSLEDAFEIVRTRPHGHVAAVVKTTTPTAL